MTPKSFQNPFEERVLGIDYGTKRIGIALSDPLKVFAYPLTTLANDITIWNELSKIIEEKNVVKIVLGYPLKESGEKAILSDEVEKFKNELEHRTNITVSLIDERYSSEIAKQNIISSVKSKKKRKDKGLVDRNAASVILQDFLDFIEKQN